MFQNININYIVDIINIICENPVSAGGETNYFFTEQINFNTGFLYRNSSFWYLLSPHLFLLKTVVEISYKLIIYK